MCQAVERADGERVAERVAQSTLGEDTDDAGGSLSQGRGERVGAAVVEILGGIEDALARRVGFVHRPARPGDGNFVLAPIDVGRAERYPSRCY